MTVYDDPHEWPALELYSDVPMFNMKAVVQHTGVPAPTLRAWERRYHLLSPVRGENDYRLYSERDIMLIRWLKQRVDSGMAISHAVLLFQHLQQERQHAPGEQHPGEKSDPSAPPMRITVDMPVPGVQLAVRPGADHSEQVLPLDLPLYSSERTLLQTDAPGPHSKLDIVRDRLINSFNELDESSANMIMGSLLAVYPVEQLCMELIAPTLWHIGVLWTAGKLTITTEHFASNFFRALLSNLFHVTSGPRDGPLVLVCGAPGEPHELAALMLALFLRRSNIRVAYLGQSIESTSLLHTIRKLSVAMVCTSLTMPAYLPALAHLSRQVEQLPRPQPLFVFGGQVFAHYPGAITQIRGKYLEGDLREVTQELQNQLQECSKNQTNQR